MKRVTSTLLLAALALGVGATGCGSDTSTNGASATSAAISSAARQLESRDGGDRDGDGDDDARDEELRVSYFKAVLNQLRAVPALAPLFDRFGVPDPIVYDEHARGLVALLHAVRIRIGFNTLTITNRDTGGVIYAAPLGDLASGTLQPEHLPGASPSPDPTTCTSFTYGPWGACDASGTQTRTVLKSAPAGCTGGAPVTSQPCVYVPPTPACGSCHAIPPATGQHAFHVGLYACSTCHGAGYSATSVNAATHQNGTVDVAASAGFTASSSSCANACHGTRSW